MKNNTLKLIINSSITGVIPATLEGILIYSVEPTISQWMVIQATLFWFTCGFVVYQLNTGENIFLISVGFTMFLNLPWYIAESIVKNKPEHFIPLVIASIVQGIIIGSLTKWLNNGKAGQKAIYE
ncbi:MAG: hypothetical protein K8R21_14820 [Leptospira sp.]|nr:hypothetical protein [Leptospira sp.]